MLGVGLIASPASAADGQPCTVIGTNGPDRLQGTPGDDVICGRNGDDVLVGGGGDDVLDGGNGTDSLDGGPGIDNLRGGNGSDVLIGAEGADILDGGNGDDSLQGGADEDVLAGGNGTDALAGGPGDDYLDGGNGPDSCDGGTGVATFVDCESTTEETTPEPEDPNADTDEDGLPAALEAALGSSTRTSDTDGDGLGDAAEFDTSTDPLVADTDGDGVLDGADDSDGDGITNRAELDSGSDPARADTDSDGLRDDIEASLGTNVDNGDSDADNLNDHQEVQLGSDPLNPDTDQDGTTDSLEQFTRTITAPQGGPSLALSGLASAVLDVDLATPSDTRLLEVPGAVSAAVEVGNASGVRGTLTIPFDPALAAPGANLAVLHFDDDTDLFDRPAIQSIDLAGGMASVTTDDFSPFVVVDLDEFGDVFPESIPSLGDLNPDPIDFGLLLDLSVARDDDAAMWARHRAASHAVVDAMRPGDRVMLMSYPWYTPYPMYLTDDLDAVHAAIDEAYAITTGSTYPIMGDALSRLISELELGVDDGRATSIIAFGDGGGWTYPWGGMPEAVAHGVPISVIAFEPLYIEEQVQAIADDSGGVLIKILPEQHPDVPVRALLDTAEARPLSDRDNDGLPDVVEVEGMPTATGEVYRTNPNEADTDGDQLPDGEEMRAHANVYALVGGSTFKPYSNPTDPDTDNDGLDDWYEVANISRAFDADFDRDGLDDYAELMVHQLEPLSDDTDTDGFTDAWEIDHADQGFDADIYDIRYEWWEYAGDFSRGTLCGEADFWEFCQSDSIAFFAGSLAAGFIGVGDIRDSLANLGKGEFLASGLSLAMLLPVVGDTGSVAVKMKRLLDDAKANPGPALRFVGKATSLPKSVRIQALDDAFDGAVTTLKGKGLDEDTILNFARRGMSPAHVVKMLDGAVEVRPGVGRFANESMAEDVLRERWKTDIDPGRPGIPLTAGGDSTSGLSTSCGLASASDTR